MNGVTTYEKTFVPFLGAHPPLMESVTIASSGTARDLMAGTVLAVVTASGKLKEFAPGASDGSQTPTHILAEDCSVPASSDLVAVAYTHCEALDRGLVWPQGITAPQKAAAIAALRDAGIFVTLNQPA
jgi:hypothetical protein